MWYCLIKFDLLQAHVFREFVHSWAKQHINGHGMRTMDNLKWKWNFQLWTSMAYELIFELKCWQWATDVIVERNCFFLPDLSFGGYSGFNLLFILIQSNELLLGIKKNFISYHLFNRSFVNFAHYRFNGVKSWNAINLIAVNVHYHFQFPLEFYVNLKCTPNRWIRCAFHTSLCRIGWTWKYPNLLPFKLCDYKKKK